MNINERNIKIWSTIGSRATFGIAALELAKEIDNLNVKKIKIQELYDKKLQSIPNLIHNTVPRGTDFNSNLEVVKWNPKIAINKKAKDHIEISLKNDLIDIERAAKISGSRFYFLKSILKIY